MDWYYLIHKYNTKSSRAKLGDTGKKSTIDLELYTFQNVDFSKQMFPGISKKEQDRVRARFSMDVTKRCSAEIKQAHKHREKINY
jgi:hypothetical protein